MANGFPAQPRFEAMHPPDAFCPARPAIPELRVFDVCGGLVFRVATSDPFNKIHFCAFPFLTLISGFN
jgi:hypothetical protein